MTRSFFAAALGLTWFAAMSCSDSTSPAGGECTAQTGAVTATITVGATVTFDWTPKCAVAMVLVEEGASDRWLFTSPEDSWTSAAAANKFLPPVTYGEAPAGAAASDPATSLVVGHKYELVLWRILPAGSTAQCQQMFTPNVCLLTVTEFTR